MQTHVQRFVAGCFAVLSQLRSIQRLVPSTVYQSLVTALVLPRLDYSNATLAGLPAYLLNRLQSVLNAAAWSIAGIRRSEHITDALVSFQWLRAPERIKFKLPVIIYRALNGTALIRSAAARCQSADEMPWSPLFIDFQSSRRPSVAMCYRWRSIVCYCRPSTLEQSTCRCSVCIITHNISPKAENQFISAILPRHCVAIVVLEVTFT